MSDMEHFHREIDNTSKTVESILEEVESTLTDDKKKMFAEVRNSIDRNYSKISNGDIDQGENRSSGRFSGEIDQDQDILEKKIQLKMLSKSKTKEDEKITNEIETLENHLLMAEAAFDDVHKKYEKCKAVVEVLRKNEQLLQESLRINEENIATQNNKYKALKSHASKELQKANEEISILKQTHADETRRLNALIKKLQLKNESLEESLESKIKECEKLSRICDEMIGTAPSRASYSRRDN